MLASLAEKIPLRQTVVDVEAAAARRAIMFAKELNLSSIILKGDSEIITRALQAEDQSLALMAISSRRSDFRQTLLSI